MSTQPHRVQRSVRLRQDDGHSCPRPFLAVLEISASDNPGRLAEIFREAAAAGYKAIVVDSLTNFWSGPGGALEIVGAAGNGNSWSGWKTGKPA